MRGARSASTIDCIAAEPEHHPRAFVTWAHSGEDWTDEQAEAWAEEVRTFCIVLRSRGIDVDADVFHLDEQGINWDYFGPTGIRESDFTIIAVSVPWKERWEGSNSPRAGAGAVAEANELHGIFSRDQKEFAEKVVIIELPTVIGTGAVPDGLRGVPRFRIEDISPEGLEPLLRLLTNQPENPLPELGELAVLPPSTHRSSTPTTPAGQAMNKEDQEALAAINEQIGALRSALKKIPEPEPWDGPHLPWYRSWHRVNNELFALERRRDTLMKGPVEIPKPPPAPAVALPAGSLPAVATFAELRDRAPQTPGAPGHWMLYDGVTLMRVIMAAVPSGVRHPEGADLRRALARGTDAMTSLAGNWRPNAPTLFLDDTTGDWATRRPRIWEAGMSSSSAETLQSRATASAALDTTGPVLAFDRTWNTRVDRDRGVGGGYYFAAYEPAIALELASALIFGGTVLGEFTGVEAIDVAVQISAAIKDAAGLTPADAYVSNTDPHGTPSPRITPIGPYADKHYIEVGRFTVDDLRQQPMDSARTVLGPWLVVFRQCDVFENV